MLMFTRELFAVRPKSSQMKTKNLNLKPLPATPAIGATVYVPYRAHEPNGSLIKAEVVALELWRDTLHLQVRTYEDAGLGRPDCMLPWYPVQEVKA